MFAAFKPHAILPAVGLFLLVHQIASAQLPNQPGVLTPDGVFLPGLDTFNFNTPQADSINFETMMRWKQELRKDQQEWQDIVARKATEKKLKGEELVKQRLIREKQLRESPTPEDIETGVALNALLYDLSDPAIPASEWSFKPVKLPKDLSIKDLIFRFIPMTNRSKASQALSRGVIALSRLDVQESHWPTVLKQEELDKERKAYETSYSTLREQLIVDKFDVKSLQEVDHALADLKAKVEKVIPKDRGFRDEALKYVSDLKDATRMFDAATVDYSRQILIDTKDKDAKTVGELVGFMLKYRLQFANAARNPTARELYKQLYDMMQVQTQLFAGNAAGAAGQDKANENWVSLFNGKDLTGWRQHPDSVGVWSVEGGHIVGRSPHQSYLFTQSDAYTDFHLRVEAMINETGDSGVCFRTIYFGRGIIKGKGYCAAIQGDKSKDHTGRLVHFTKSKAEEPATQPGQWFGMEVIAVGNHITIKVNGETTTDFVDPENTFKRGCIAFKQAGDKTDVHIRKVEINVLKPKK